MISDERIKEIAVSAVRDMVMNPDEQRPAWQPIASAIRQALKEALEWRDMESAPDDGSPFLARRLDHGQWVYGDCHRIVRDDCEMWYFRGTSAAHHVFPGNKPHQWLPLPPFGPTVDKGEG